MKLYDIPMDFAELEQALIESEGELSPELEKQFDDFLRGGKDKIEAAAMVVRTLEAEAEACVREAKRLKERQTSLENNADKLKKLMLIAVDAAFAGKVKTSLFTVWGQTSQPGIGIELKPGADLAEIHARVPELIRTKYELDKEAIKQASLDGKQLPGEITLYDVPGTRFLRIR
jgi:Siphovirus Gp157